MIDPTLESILIDTEDFAHRWQADVNAEQNADYIASTISQQAIQNRWQAQQLADHAASVAHSDMMALSQTALEMEQDIELANSLNTNRIIAEIADARWGRFTQSKTESKDQTDYSYGICAILFIVFACVIAALFI